MERKNNVSGIFYGVIGVATLVVAVIGATFAYFTATQTGGNNITGNMASISFGLSVEKVVDPGVTSGLVPMSNTMIEQAVARTSNSTCTDDNGNAVCQIYKVTVTNTSSAAMFVDGYVALKGGSGAPTDHSYTTANTTTMRWAQVFKTGNGEDASSHYTTAGDQILGADTEKVTLNSIDKTGDATGKNVENIITSDAKAQGTLSISGTNYTVINKNFIRVSDHKIDSETKALDSTFNRASDITSTLVLSQQLQAQGHTVYDNEQSKDVPSGKDVVTYYFVVWLSETGTNQTVGATTTGTTNTPTVNVPTTGDKFFSGVVTFVSAQGSEVTSTFAGFTATQSDT